MRRSAKASSTVRNVRFLHPMEMSACATERRGLPPRGLRMRAPATISTFSFRSGPWKRHVSRSQGLVASANKPRLAIGEATRVAAATAGKSPGARRPPGPRPACSDAAHENGRLRGACPPCVAETGAPALPSLREATRVAAATSPSQKNAPRQDPPRPFPKRVAAHKNPSPSRSVLSPAPAGAQTRSFPPPRSDTCRCRDVDEKPATRPSPPAAPACPGCRLEKPAARLAPPEAPARTPPTSPALAGRANLRSPPSTSDTCRRRDVARHAPSAPQAPPAYPDRGGGARELCRRRAERHRLRALLADPAHAFFDVRKLRPFQAYGQRELGLFAIRLRDRDLKARARERERLSDPGLLAFGGCGPRDRANLRPGDLSRLERRAEPREVIELARKLDERLRLPAKNPEHRLRVRPDPRGSKAAVEPAVGHLPERAGELRLRLLRDPNERPELSVELARLFEPRLAFRAGPLRSVEPLEIPVEHELVFQVRDHRHDDPPPQRPRRVARTPPPGSDTCRTRRGGRADTPQERHVSHAAGAGARSAFQERHVPRAGGVGTRVRAQSPSGFFSKRRQAARWAREKATRVAPVGRLAGRHPPGATRVARGGAARARHPPGAPRVAPAGGGTRPTSDTCRAPEGAGTRQARVARAACERRGLFEPPFRTPPKRRVARVAIRRGGGRPTGARWGDLGSGRRVRRRRNRSCAWLTKGRPRRLSRAVPPRSRGADISTG